MSEKLTKMLKRHEGWRAYPYKCSGGYLTIGYGRNLEARGISKLEGRILLEHDIARAKQDLGEVLEWAQELPDARYDALVDMMFNLGRGGFKTFKRMIFFLNAAHRHEVKGNRDAAERAYSLAGAEILNSRYAQQVGERAKELSFMITHNAYRND